MTQKMVLEDVISRPESFSGEILLRTRRRLGISEVVAGGMHLDIYQLAIQVKYRALGVGLVGRVVLEVVRRGGEDG